MNDKAHSKNKETARAPARPSQVDPALRSEHPSPHLGLRDPAEPTQGPLRLDDLNYSPERMTLPEGNYNAYGDDEASSQDEEDLRPGVRDPQFPEASQSEILDSLPAAGTTAGNATPWEREEAADDSPLQVGDSEARGDLVILDDINDLLAALGNADAAAIDVTVQQGIVTLEGQVGAADTRSRLAQAVEAIPGVTEICNRLGVRGEGEYPRWSDR